MADDQLGKDLVTDRRAKSRLNEPPLLGTAAPEGVESFVITVDGKRLKGRAVMSSSRSFGLSVFSAVGLGDLTDA